MNPFSSQIINIDVIAKLVNDLILEFKYQEGQVSVLAPKYISNLCDML